MARRSSRRRRDTNVIANRRLPVSFKADFPSKPFSPQGHRSTVLREFEDRRYYHPEGPRRPAASFSTPRHRLKVVGRARQGRTLASRFATSSPSAAIGFVRPKRVLVCVRRQIRREVMHALGKAGKGGQKAPRFTEYSKIRC